MNFPTYNVDSEILAQSDSFCYGELDRYTYEGSVKVYLPDLLSGSDYSGSTVHLSNYQVFLEQFSEVPGVYNVYGGHGTYAIALTEEALANEEIKECLDALSDYPLIDDEHHSNLEWESYTEGWESYGADDFIRGLKSEFNLSEDYSLVLDMIEDTSKDQLMEFYESLIPSGEYFHGESDGVYILTDYAAKNCTRDDLAAFIKQLRTA